MKKLAIILVAFIVTTMLAVNAVAVTPTPADIGKIATADQSKQCGNSPVYPWGEATKASVTSKFIAEYEAQRANGFDVGQTVAVVLPSIPDFWYYGLVHQWGSPANGAHDVYNFVVQDFGNSSAKKTVQGIPKAAKMVMYDVNHPAFTISGEVYVFYDSCGSIDVAGAPRSNTFTYNGDTYQLFSSMFIKLGKGKSMAINENFDVASKDIVIPKAALGVGYTGSDMKVDTNGNLISVTVGATSTTSSKTISNASSKTNTSSVTASAAVSSTVSSSLDSTTVSSDVSSTIDTSSTNQSGTSSTSNKSPGSTLPIIIAIAAVAVLGGGAAVYYFIIRKKHM